MERTIGGFDSYITSARKFAHLTKENELEIIKKAQAGDKKSADTLYCSNLMLVAKIANEYRGLLDDIEDLIQEGNIGLLKALKKFDTSLGYRFTTYAGWWVRSMMLRYIFANIHIIKPGATSQHRKLFFNLRKEQSRLEAMGITPEAETIAKNLNVSEEAVFEMTALLRPDVYLSSPVVFADRDDGESLSSIITAPAEERPDVVAECKQYTAALRHKIDEFAKKLNTDRQREIFFKRIIADDPETLQSIGDTFSITKERARQIEAQVIVKLRHHLKELAER